jgi:hypothetical protein
VSPGYTLASVSDEALVLFLLENSWECWVEKFNRQLNKERVLALQ